VKPTALLLVCATAAFAQDWASIPAGGESMLPADSAAAMRLTGGQLARMEMVAVEGMPFSRAVRVEVRGPLTQAWDVQLMANTTGDVKVGDIVLLSGFIRGSSSANETGEATATAYLQRSSGDFAKVASLTMTGGPEWKQFLAPGRIETTLGPGQHGFTIFLGMFPQTVEIGGISLINYRNLKTLAELPRTKITWPGSEPDAPWRAEAAAAIDVLRKADVEVRVRDRDGRPVSGAEIRVRQKKHEFGFGSAVAADGLNAQNADGDKYRETIRTWFNKAVLENDLKWPGWEQNRNRAIGALSWLRQNGIGMVRGHNLVWPSWRYMPSDVERLAGNPDALRDRINRHIDDEAASVRGWLTEWDVINEAFTNTDVQKVLGNAEMVEWFRRARNHDPDAVLYINDYSILSGGGLNRPHQDGYFNIIRSLIEAGAPVGGIGMQGHFGAQLTAPVKVWQILDRFAVFGKDIQITEFDIDTDDEEAQAGYTRDFMTALFSHPNVSGFMMWGFWEGRHWRPRAAMFRRDWSIKPNGKAFYDLVYGEWWTNAAGTTGDAGTWKVRAFKGEHEVEVRVAGQSVIRPITVNWAGAVAEITLP